MPQTHRVVLNYDTTKPSPSFGPSPRQVFVAPSDTIQFQIGESTRLARPDGKLRITLHNGGPFSQTVLQHSASQSGAEPLSVAVRPGSAAALAAAAALTNNIISGYKCELLDNNGTPVPGLSSDGASGGEILPDPGTS